jgi:carboxymethylenebutenolidase
MSRIASRNLTIQEDGIPGFIAHPDEPGKHPGVMFIHHANGVSAELKIYAAELAQAGFVAIVPSLFELLGIQGMPGHHGSPPSYIGRGVEAQNQFDDQAFLRVIDAAWQGLIARNDIDQDCCGLIAYCMGGRLAIPFAVDTPLLRAMALLYPSVRDEPISPRRPRNSFELAKTLKCASMVLFGGCDYIATPAIQHRLWESFVTNGSPLEWHYYSHGNHGFASPDTIGYQPDLARSTWPMVCNFLKHHLRNPL